MATSVLLEARPYRPFKSSEEYLEAMREDLAEWLNTMYPELMINADNFMDRLDTGVALCKHANNVRKAAEDYLTRRQARNKSMTRSMTSGLAGPILAMGNVHYLPAAKSGTFFARDNVSNFITWCRKSLKIFECLLFETDDLIMRKNEKHVILCLLEVARRGAKFGMAAPMLVQMERQIDKEIAADNKANGIGCGTQTDLNETNNISTETDVFDTDTEDEDENDDGPLLFYGPQPQIITNDLKSLDEMVRDLVEKCTCPSQFPMIRVSEGKYRIGDTKVLIFVRILRSHVMVRVGGGWDTLSHYLDKHDPCRCRAQHRSSVAARFIPRTNASTNGIELHKAQVIFERSPPMARKVISALPSSSNNINSNINTNGITNAHSSGDKNNTNSNLSPPSHVGMRSRSPTPNRKPLSANSNTSGNNISLAGEQQVLCSPILVRRSMSPSPRRFNDIRRKQQNPIDGNGSQCFTPKANNIQSEQNNDLPIDQSPNHSNESKTTSVGNNQLPSSNSASENSSNKFENISDNGSEISDEGYRSLGMVPPGSSNANGLIKRESNDTVTDDAENNVHLEEISTDSQISPSEEPTPSKISESHQHENENGEDNSLYRDGKEESLKDLENHCSSKPDKASQLVPEPKEQTGDLSTAEEVSSGFEKSGVFITDDEITIDIASTTGLRKTGFSDKIYGTSSSPDGNESINEGEYTSLNLTNKICSVSKIPRSPVPSRRRSADNISIECDSEFTARTGLPVFNRKQTTYRSVRVPGEKKSTASPTRISSVKKQTTTTPTVVVTSKTPTQVKSTSGSTVKGKGKDRVNTWSGRGSATVTPTKKRPSITSETFTSPLHTSSSSNGTNKINFERNSKTRTSHILYDSKGRPIRGGSFSVNTSPIKNHISSPLAQQLLEAANNAKSDVQILQKMKQLLSEYSAKGNFTCSNGNASKNITITNKGNNSQQFDDFTTAWVHNNGILDRSSNFSPNKKATATAPHSKRSSIASSTESNHSKDAGAIIAPRKDRGLSKIPAPVRHNTELY